MLLTTDPFTLEADVGSDTGGNAGRTSANFGDTVTITGFEFVDSAGNPIPELTDVQVMSSMGIPYVNSAQAPEPGGLLAIVAAAGLCRRARGKHE